MPYSPRSGYLTHLSMEGNGCEPQIPKQEGSPLSVIARTAEYHERVPSKLIQNVNEVTVLKETTPESEREVTWR